jgi:hypothetical protein
MKNYDKEIEELENKLKILKEEKKSYDLMQPNYKLAEIIHGKVCRHNHEDGCGWYYEKWDGFGKNSTRMSYLEKANKILEKVSFINAVHVISNL